MFEPVEPDKKNRADEEEYEQVYAEYISDLLAWEEWFERLQHGDDKRPLPTTEENDA